LSSQIELAPAAVRQLKKSTPDVRRRIQGVLELLADDPRPPAATQLVGGSGEWRVRSGDNRVIYEIHAQQVLVLVLRVAHRRDVDDRSPHGLTLQSEIVDVGPPTPGRFSTFPQRHFLDGSAVQSIGHRGRLLEATSQVPGNVRS
jgi:mRNA interferase RelE/StbE